MIGKTTDGETRGLLAIICLSTLRTENGTTRACLSGCQEEERTGHDNRVNKQLRVTKSHKEGKENGALAQVYVEDPSEYSFFARQFFW